MNTMTDDRLLLTPREASLALAVSERTLWSLTAAGEIPRLKIGRLVRYSVRDLERWIERGRQNAKRENGAEDAQRH